VDGLLAEGSTHDFSNWAGGGAHAVGLAGEGETSRLDVRVLLGECGQDDGGEGVPHVAQHRGELDASLGG